MKCLDKLHPQIQTTEESYEVIVSDDSKENIAKALITEKYNWVKWIEGPKKGPAANRNNGAAMAKGNWLVFIDDDCEPGKTLIKFYENAITKYKSIKVFEGYIGVDREQRNFMEEAPINTTGGYLWSCNFMIEKNLFKEKLNGFDEQYPFASMEDVDLHYRLKKLGEHIQFIASAKVIHPWRLQLNPIEIGEKRFLSMLYFINKFPEKKKDYSSKYYIQAFFSTAKSVVKNSFRYRFRGFLNRIIVIFMQLHFAVKIKRNNNFEF